jgi:hypothetical protein
LGPSGQYFHSVYGAFEEEGSLYEGGWKTRFFEANTGFFES